MTTWTCILLFLRYPGSPLESAVTTNNEAGRAPDRLKAGATTSRRLRKGPGRVRHKGGLFFLPLAVTAPARRKSWAQGGARMWKRLVWRATWVFLSFRGQGRQQLEPRDPRCHYDIWNAWQMQRPIWQKRRFWHFLFWIIYIYQLFQIPKGESEVSHLILSPIARFRA